MKKGKSPKGPLYYILIFALVFVVAYGIQMLAINFSGQVVNLEFSEFVQDLQTGQVESVKVNAGSRSYEGQLKNGEYYLAYAPSEYDMNTISEKYIVPMAADGSLTVLSVKPSMVGEILSWVPSIIMFIMIIILYKNMLGGGGNKGVMGFGKNKARMEKDSKVTFKDVAGCEEEKQELSEIVDF